MENRKHGVSRSLLAECWDLLKVSGRRKRVSNCRSVIGMLLGKSARGFVFYLDGDMYELADVSRSSTDSMDGFILSARRIPSCSGDVVSLSLSDLELNGSLCLCMFADGLLDYMLVSYSAWRSFCGSVELRDCLSRIVNMGVELHRSDKSYSYSLDISSMGYEIGDDCVSISRFCVSVDIGKRVGDIVEFSLYDSEGKVINADNDALYCFIYSFIREF